ncbi:MAG TPA: GNAT family N-acetyltransferase, partial [Acidimicrobiales bacterium]|nr:GNAT family N-acetyltransferase [Acidimicrobiales bacterium]
LGYRLWRWAWGQGYATEGARALIAHAFTRLDVCRIWAETMAVNTASRRVMERSGLRYVRTFHFEWDDPLPGTEHGAVEYEILGRDWESGSPASE